MGCDVHFNVERYNPKLKKWIYVKGPFRDCWSCNRNGGSPDKECGICKGTGRVREEFYEGRNYNLFAMLADVRNDEGIIPLDAPRDIPGNATAEVKRKSDGWGEDGHSHSWFYLSELLDESYWNREVAHTGLVDLDTYETWKARGSKFPDSWCKGVNSKIVSEEEAASLLSDKALSASRRLGGGGGPFSANAIHVKATWRTTYRDSVKEFLDNTVPELRKLAKNPRHVRIIFWFDN